MAFLCGQGIDMWNRGCSSRGTIIPESRFIRGTNSTRFLILFIWQLYCAKSIQLFARVYSCVRTHICVRARMKVGAQVARTRKTSLTRVRSSSTRISLHICARPYWCFRNNTDLRKKNLMFWFCLSHPYERHETASKIALRHAGRALSLLQPAFRSST